MARRRWALVIEIIADSIRIEHLRGDELPANAAKMVTQSEFVACVDSETVREGQRPAGFLHDRPLVSAGNQERREAEKKKSLESHERWGCFGISVFRRRPNFSISANPEAISKTGHIPQAQFGLLTRTRVNSTQENHYALDNICHSAGALAARFGQFIHDGRIHSHPARNRGRDSDHQPHRRPADFVAR
jgi:hypothetical protein